MTLAVILALLLQAPAAPRAAEPGAGVIRGRVTAADTGKPLKRATVRLQVLSGPDVRLTASTNSLGAFELVNVPSGQYLVVVMRAGYLDQQYGQKRANERGATVDVGAGATVEKIDVALPRGGVLAGHLLDDRGEAYQGAEVMALRAAYLNGKRTYTIGRGTSTDDIGQFRIAGLAPGSYLLVAISNETWRTDAKATVGFGSTYYPGVSVDAAQPIVLAPGQQRLDLDFSLRAAPAVTVSGQMQSETGTLRPNAGVSLWYQFGSGSLTYGIRNARAAADGTFAFKDVTEGAYQLTGAGPGESVIVRDSDVTGLMLVDRTGSAVSGTLVTEDGTPPPFSPSGVRVNTLAPFGKVLPAVRVAGLETDWSFKFDSLGGPFLFRLLGLPSDWVLGSVKLGEQDITDAPWDVPTGGRKLGGLKIVVTQKVSRITGAIADADGRPASDGVALVFSDDEKLWIPGSRFVRTVRPGATGQFTLTGMPAGTYRAVARESIEEGQWDDPSFLEQLRDEAVRFVLDEGGTHTLALKLPVRK